MKDKKARQKDTEGTAVQIGCNWPQCMAISVAHMHEGRASLLSLPSRWRVVANIKNVVEFYCSEEHLKLMEKLFEETLKTPEIAPS
jgi:hypothetical protein